MTYELPHIYQHHSDNFFPNLRPSSERVNNSTYGTVLDYDYSDKFGNDLQMQMSNQRYKQHDKGEMVHAMESAVCTYVEKFSGDHVFVLKSAYAPVKTFFRHIVRWCGLRYKNIDDATVLAYPTPEMRIPEPSLKLSALMQNHNNAGPPSSSSYSDRVQYDHPPSFPPTPYHIRDGGPPPFRQAHPFGYPPRGRGGFDCRFRPAGGSNNYRGGARGPRQHFGGGGFRFTGPANFGYPTSSVIVPVTYTQQQPYEGNLSELSGLPQQQQQQLALQGTISDQHQLQHQQHPGIMKGPETTDAASTAAPTMTAAGEPNATCTDMQKSEANGAPLAMHPDPRSVVASEPSSVVCTTEVTNGYHHGNNNNNSCSSGGSSSGNNNNNGIVAMAEQQQQIQQQPQYEMVQTYANNDPNSYGMGQVAQQMSTLTIQTGGSPGDPFGPSPLNGLGRPPPPGQGLLYIADPASAAAQQVQMYQQQQPGAGYPIMPQQQQQQMCYQQAPQFVVNSSSPYCMQTMLPPGTMWAAAMPQESQSSHALAGGGVSSTLNPAAAPFLHTPVPSGMAVTPNNNGPAPPNMMTTQNNPGTPMNGSQGMQQQQQQQQMMTYATPPPPLTIDTYGRAGYSAGPAGIQQMWMAPPPQQQQAQVGTPSDGGMMQGARLVPPTVMPPSVYYGVRPSPAPTGYLPAGMTPVNLGSAGTVYGMAPQAQAALMATPEGMAYATTQAPQNVHYIPVQITPQLLYQPGLPFINGTQYVQLTPVHQQLSLPYRNGSRQSQYGSNRQSRH